MTLALNLLVAALKMVYGTLTHTRPLQAHGFQSLTDGAKPLRRNMKNPRLPPGAAALPFPTSLCHTCAAPPRYIQTQRSTFILCPLLPEKYPRQPVVHCPLYRARSDDDPA